MLRGRRAELERIDAFLDAAREGTSGALVVRGEPGIGKTALLDHAAQRAGDMRVLRGAGIEPEAELPFAGLHLLVHSALGGLDALPAPQRRTLSGAFGPGAGGGDRFLIGAGVLSLLAHLAEEVPLLCLVDDEQRLDRPSAARRKTEAREHLGAALAVPDELGSTPWAARARAELDASGARAVQNVPARSAPAGLTPQELQITRSSRCRACPTGRSPPNSSSAHARWPTTSTRPTRSSGSAPASRSWALQ
jgi:hypothetical protein